METLPPRKAVRSDLGSPSELAGIKVCALQFGAMGVLTLWDRGGYRCLRDQHDGRLESWGGFLGAKLGVLQHTCLSHFPIALGVCCGDRFNPKGQSCARDS